MQNLLSSQYQSAVIEALDQNTIVALTDRAGKILHVNETFCRISGYSAKELIGKTHAIVNSGYHSREFMHELWETILSGDVWRGEICNRRKDGSLYWVKTVITPLRDTLGEIENFLAIRQDITELKEAQARLAALRSQFQSIVENAPDIIVRFDRHLRHIYINKAIEKATGLTQADYLGKTNEELGMPDDIAREWRKNFGLVFETKKEHITQFSFPTPEGERFFEARLVPELDENGVFDTIICVTRDITKQRQAETVLKERDARLQGIIDGLPGMVGYWDTNLCNRFANKSYLEWFGKLPHEIHGIHIRELLGHQLFELNQPYFEKALQGERQIFERAIPRPDGTTRWTQAYYIPDNQAGKIIGFYVFVFDISAIKEAEMRAKEANEAKNRFLSNVSHELRTPLNGILGFAQLISMNSQAPAILREYGGHVEASAEHLLALINELLDFGRIEAGAIQIEPEQVTLERALRTVIELITVQARARDLAFTVEFYAQPTTMLNVDVKRLRQVLLNLLTNAVKFTQHGSVQLRLAIDKDLLCFEVSDQGIGIDAADLQRLFIPFSQVGEKSFRSQGLGLGLAISQQLVQAMGGEITVTSTVGQGSTFSFALPCLDRAGAKTSLLQPMQSAKGKLRLTALYVEDDYRGRQLMQEFLRDSEIDLLLAEDATSALKIAEQAKPDLFLLDLNLPDMSGFDLMARIRATDWGSNKPVIAISADHMQPTRDRALESGVAEFVPKPINLARLNAVLSRYAPHG
ncbi:MAG: PAS domain S-box protein [Spirochaetota bacterium]